jgi:RNA polymerase sigma factor (sigma-70 family)
MRKDELKLSDETLAETMRDQPEMEAAGAWMELRRRYLRITLKYLERCTNNHPDTEDLNEEVWVIKIWLQRKSYDSMYLFTPWMWMFTSRVLRSWLRRRYTAREAGQFREVRVNGDLQAWLEEMADPHKDQEFTTRFRRAWDKLPKEYQDLLKLRFFDGLTQEEAALRLGHSTPTIRKRERQAKKLFKWYLEGEGIPVRDED